jgi:ABC-type glycerol-3-phosphate transport system substrate-binding protein
VSKYMIPGYALPLDDVVRNLDQYNDGILDPYKHDGVLYGLPGQGHANGMAINLDIMADIGYTVPENWTVDDFLEMCELVKQFYGGEKWGTFMYAKTMSGDYMLNTWWGAFGAEMFASGDYSRTTIRETGGAKVHEFYQRLQREGYIPPGSATLDDGGSFGLWGEGKFAAVPFFAGWVETYQKIGVERGFEKFDLTFVEFPSATGEPVPVYLTGATVMVVETGTAADAMAARFAEYLEDANAQAIMTRLGGTPPNRKDAILQSADPFQALIGAIAAENGVQDIGGTSPFAAAVRAQHFPILQRVLNFELTPEESIALYEKAVNEALSY